MVMGWLIVTLNILLYRVSYSASVSGNSQSHFFAETVVGEKLLTSSASRNVSGNSQSHFFAETVVGKKFLASSALGNVSGNPQSHFFAETVIGKKLLTSSASGNISGNSQRHFQLPCLTVVSTEAPAHSHSRQQLSLLAIVSSVDDTGKTNPDLDGLQTTIMLAY